MGLVLFVVALSPALTAIWSVPWFLTQDGPAHLYNAQIIALSGNHDSPFREEYRVRWDPFPNWTGHLATLLCLRVLDARQANRVMTSLTLVGFATAILWLRWFVAGWCGMPVAALLATILALNVTWLLGFTSFLLGACLFPVTLGIWWGGRDRLGWRRIGGLWILLIVGYFSHLVSLGLTVVGLGVLSVFAPGTERLTRIGRTAICLIPLVPLGLQYLSLSHKGGPMRPEWQYLSDPASSGAWFAQARWVDPISLARKVSFPFYDWTSLWCAGAAPVLWFAVAVGLTVVATVVRRGLHGRRCWGILALLLIVGGLVGPDTLGPTHGHYLPQRVVLLGLVALVPFVELEAKGWIGVGAAVLLVVAVTVQSCFVWDYARTSDRIASEWASADVGHGKRIATLLIRTRNKFRANPLLHADNLLGLDTGNIVWSNYETRYYYFPVQFLDGIDRPSSTDLEWIALNDDLWNSKFRRDVWESLLAAHEAAIDTLVVWGDDPKFTEINERWFQETSATGNLHILRHR